MSRRVLSFLAVPVGAAVASTAVGFQLLCEPSREEASKEAKETHSKWWPSRQQKAARNDKQCDLTGWWENDLGSKMHVFKVNNDGTFSGEYYTAVSSTQKPIQPSPLFGSQHLDEDGQCTFGFTVNWKKFSDSTAVFVGQCFNEDNGKEILKTSWLLREKVNSKSDDWKATRIGRNIFTRTG